ncbi:MAG: SRPBCC domain-containing protein [Thermoplasmata archaeon]|nr:SRPBCC domain-containing protein [Thermoplasmata archaeon]
MPSIVIDLEFAAPVEDLWAAFTDQDRIAKWLCSKANIVLEEGGAYELFWDPEHPEGNSTLGCRIQSLEEEYSLRTDWRGPPEFADVMNATPLPTTLFVRFQPLGPSRSRLHLEHLGWGEGDRWTAARAWQQQSWDSALVKLRPLLES